MFTKLFNNSYYVTNKKMKSPQEWIDYCESFMKIRVYKDFWSCLPETDDKVMLLGTEKINNRDCYVSRPVLLDWHYDSMGWINPEEVLCLYCIVPTQLLQLQIYIKCIWTHLEKLKILFIVQL